MFSKAVLTSRIASHERSWDIGPAFWPAGALAMQPALHAGARRDAQSTYHIEIAQDWTSAATSWAEMAGEATAGAFQQPFWLDAWYAAHASAETVEPRIIVARDRADGTLALALPLIVHSRRGLRVAAFADCDLTDYNAPLLGAAAPHDPEGAERLWRALIAAALADVDFVELKKMPAAIGCRPNPLALLPRTAPCAVNGNIVETGEDYDAWRRQLGRSTRRDIARSWQLFASHENAAFRRITDVAEALRVLAVMERQQSERMATLGHDYILDGAEARAFYRELIVAGLASGDVILTVLACGEDIVAALLGIRDRTRYAMIRISHAGADWSKCSPGRLVIERSMALAHALGCRQFDFGIGDYDYKRRLGAAPLLLVDYVTALNWRALPDAARSGAVQWLRRHPELDRTARRWLRRGAAARISPAGGPAAADLPRPSVMAGLLASSEPPPAIC